MDKGKECELVADIMKVLQKEMFIFADGKAMYYCMIPKLNKMLKEKYNLEIK